MTTTEKPHVAVILNGISLHKKIFFSQFLPALQVSNNVEVFETLTKNDAISLSSKAVDQNKFRAIIAAGGDGTLHQVVNGVLEKREGYSALPAVGLIPMGSGNDFAKTVRIKDDPQRLVELVKLNKPKKINTGKIYYTDFSGQQRSRYFVNVADIGMGPEVVQRVNESGRAFGAAVAYYKSIIATFFTYKPMIIRAKSNDWIWSGKLRSMAIANGKYYGHGLCVAPDAILDDDMFNVFICGNVSVVDFIRYSETMKRGKHVVLPEILYKTTTDIELSSEEDCLIEGDGEILGKLPARIELSSQKIDFLM
jgi:diacylglycerol kinase (ATP)